MSGTFDPNHFDAERPTAFYLEDESLADLADSVWAVGDRELPVHSQIVAQRSSVLRAAYRIERGSCQGEVRCEMLHNDMARMTLPGAGAVACPSENQILQGG